MGVGGCYMNEDKSTNTWSQDKDSELVLNQRQKEILAINNLPTTYQDLDEQQRYYIFEIEKRLSYLEEKYDKAFGYIGYTSPSLQSEELLIAYPLDGDRDFDVVRVEAQFVDGEVKYQDNYTNILVQPLLEGYLKEFFDKYLGEVDIFIYTVVGNSDFEGIEELPTDFSALDNHIGSSSMIFFDSQQITIEQFEELADAYEAWGTSHQISMLDQLILLKPNYLNKITRYNYTDYLLPEYYLNRKNIIVNTNDQ